MEREEEYYDALGVEPMDTSDEERLEEEVRSFFLNKAPLTPHVSLSLCSSSDDAEEHHPQPAAAAARVRASSAHAVADGSGVLPASGSHSVGSSC